MDYLMEKNVLNFTLKQLETKITKLNEKKFRAQQIFDWIYKKNIFDFEYMSNIPKSLIDKLNIELDITLPKIIKINTSKIDKSIKFLLETKDKNLIESLAILENKRVTLCISCMIGCPLKCKFCATGTELKFKRNLDASEIIGQYITINNFLKEKNIFGNINNVVFMGMGEPFLNLNNIEKSIEIFTHKKALDLSKKKLVISTSGVDKGLSDFINKFKIKLAVSIHFPTNEQRSQFMPINKKVPLEKLITELKKIDLKKREYITIEYLMIEKINDTLFHAEKLKSLLKGLKVKVNLIPYNPTKMFFAKPSSEKRINKFANYLLSKSIFVTVRRSKSKDVTGACGQFALKNNGVSLLK
ncbi:23S rRNA (adenine(2503)-C(2))-methyltransferase RlmN [Candidatus Dependentiae bacterium]|nr:23S rRNA (adenine(2503)-C(2))-methyltransferase RlmN [Candidatus Dependentiae bacterium]